MLFTADYPALPERLRGVEDALARIQTDVSRVQIELRQLSALHRARRREALAEALGIEAARWGGVEAVVLPALAQTRRGLAQAALAEEGRGST